MCCAGPSAMYAAIILSPSKPLLFFPITCTRFGGCPRMILTSRCDGGTGTLKYSW